MAKTPSQPMKTAWWRIRTAMAMLVILTGLDGCTAASVAPDNSTTDAPRNAERVVHEAVEEAELGDKWFELEAHGGSHGRIVTHEVHGYAGATVCKSVTSMTRWVPIFYFRRGTDELVGGNEPLASCRNNDNDFEGRPLPECQKLFHRAYKNDARSFDEAVIHGFTWPEEREDPQRAIELSRRRAEAIQEWIGGTELSIEYDIRVQAHGTARTNIEMLDEASKPSVVVGGSVQIDEDDLVPKAQRIVGPSLDESSYVTFAKKLAKANANDTDINENSGIFETEAPFLKARYRWVKDCPETEHAEAEKCVFSSSLSGEYVSVGLGFSDAARMYRWAAQMFDNGCEVSKAGIP